MTGVSRRTGGTVPIAYDVAGTGPAVVLLHGTSASHAVWDPVVDVLRTSATAIALDQRGHGRSAKPPVGYAADDFAADVVHVLDDLSLERAVVVGHSLGARNAWVAAARYPDRIAAAVCVDYTPFVAPAVLNDLRDRVAAGHRAFADIDEVEEYLAARYVRLPPDAVARRARAGYRRDADGRWWPLADPSAMSHLIDGFGREWAEEFEAAAVPMVHVRGVDSRIVDHDAWDRARRLRPRDRWIVVDGADHYVPEECPDLVAAETLDLLNAVLPSSI
ncbi:alpha/beta fold hydrolase [Microbacterium trichothecenolyticum]|uniref:2-(Acetamidomethylene)succinate hydrolase n=1 Tax=Microbacterium trichothecenolyticum TaxID=69370 RepID=A0ABU0TXV2_MICTR|nr:alpha/beta hydrolase [Microbacterium trichothecenolyticum]MDQ1124497.1 2-(acetamidomethylene)succinate hydrolase [Microbacterium trichothecenolyticum]